MNDVNPKHYFEMSLQNDERPAQIPIRKSRLDYLLNGYVSKESDRWTIINQPDHFVIYDKKTKFCIYDAEYTLIKDQFEYPDPICAVITKIKINSDPNQHPSDIEDDFGTVADLLEKEL